MGSHVSYFSQRRKFKSTSVDTSYLKNWERWGMIYGLGSSQKGRPQAHFLLYFYYFPFSKIMLLV